MNFVEKLLSLHKVALQTKFFSKSKTFCKQDIEFKQEKFLLVRALYGKIFHTPNAFGRYKVQKLRHLDISIVEKH